MNNDVNGLQLGLPAAPDPGRGQVFHDRHQRDAVAGPAAPARTRSIGSRPTAARSCTGTANITSSPITTFSSTRATRRASPRSSTICPSWRRGATIPYDIIGFHVSGYVTDNCPPKKELSDRVREWNANWAYPKLRLATMSEFFAALEKNYARVIPIHKLGWPDYWTDGIASTAFETGLNRAAHAELRGGRDLGAWPRASPTSLRLSGRRHRRRLREHHALRRAHLGRAQFDQRARFGVRPRPMGCQVRLRLHGRRDRQDAQGPEPRRIARRIPAPASMPWPSSIRCPGSARTSSASPCRRPSVGKAPVQARREADAGPRFPIRSWTSRRSSSRPPFLRWAMPSTPSRPTCSPAPPAPAAVVGRDDRSRTNSTRPSSTP